MRLTTALAAVALAVWLLCPGPDQDLSAADRIAAATEVPAGTYTLDRNHASLIFRVDHLGFSHYTARFTRFDARLELDPADPAASSVTATIDPGSIETDNPDPALDFDHLLQNQDWLSTAQFPEMTFRSTKVELTAPNMARVFGALDLHGVRREVMLNVTFNGGYAANPLDPSGSRIGFSAQGALRRSEFGLAAGLPPPGSRFGVGDEVEILIEAEFTRPAPVSRDQR
jgi:polyisoprenoid-binding protein YceI